MTQLETLTKSPRIHGHTRQGLKHTDNQDRYAWFRCGPGSDTDWSAAPGESVFVVAVADGVTTQAAGANASELAVTVLRRTFAQQANTLPVRQRLEEAFVNANRTIVEAAAQKTDFKGMSTTLVAAVIQGWTLHVAHLGDSRVYLIRNGRFYRLTLDHTWIQEAMDAGRFDSDPEKAKTHTNRHNLTRHLGASTGIQVDHAIIYPGTDGDRAKRKMVASLDLQPGDGLLLCSDGLYDKIETQIGAIIAKSNGDPDTSVKRLIKSALSLGETDDITGTLLVMPEPGGLRAPLAGASWRSRLVTAGLSLLALALVVYGALTFVQRSDGATLSDGAVNAVNSDTVSDTVSDTASADAEFALADGSPAGENDPASENDSTSENDSATSGEETVTANVTAVPGASQAAEQSGETSEGVSSTPTGEITPLATPATPLATTTKIPTATPESGDESDAAATAVPVEPASAAASASEPVADAVPAAPEPVAAPASSSACDECAVNLIAPLEPTLQGTKTFQWQPNFALDADQFLYEMVFWEEGQDALVNGFGPAGSISQEFVEVDLDQASRILPGLLKSGSDYRWGVVLVDAEDTSQRIKFLGGEHAFHFTATSSGGSSGGGDGGSNGGGGDSGGNTGGGGGGDDGGDDDSSRFD